MKKQLAMILSLLLWTIAFANENKSGKLSYQLTNIKSLSITTNGGWSDNINGNETPKMCKSFLLKESDVKQFFIKSKQVTERAYAHDLPAAMCYADGDISFENGTKGKWKIDQARRGILMLSNDAVFYFYCKKCNSKVFAEN